ncbi:hypothetical protein H9L10_15395 [Phycicoccus endophyticus]|uniref:Uncharacterized protein n=1 Tax=Phycicoccus endophyticus TaxID=1690220 RepID=A0A7G9R1Q8_9MICO|nr:hypothetical protein [Phycicoccus endophyticus]NHI18675.1 hypothetical protein [Phycicoccus endophyticus]QNN49533.1 hypothetical protein H9L10_15395 [Phycicoccus endophyticus]GGL37339.1 hypothetical protein GCM10012283_19910 [Phycicoccus endophyticus]
MSLLALVVLPVSFALVLGVLLVGLLTGVTAGLPRASDDVGRAARRRVHLATGATVLVSMVLGGLALRVADDRALAVTPLAIATLVVLAATVLERTWPRPSGTLRTAGIRPRPEPPRLLHRLWWGATWSLAGVCVGGTLLAGPDGRSVGAEWATGSSASSPFPGARYAAPILAALLLCVLVTSWGLRTVEHRPALDAEHAQLDRAARVASTARLLRVSTVGTLLTLAGTAFVASSSLRSLAESLRNNGAPIPGQAPFDWRQHLAVTLLVVAVLALGLAVVALVSAPTRRDEAQPRPRASAPGVVAR